MKLSEFRLSHDIKLRRKRLGCSPVSGRPTFGWDVACSCGWEMKSNEDQRHAVKYHNWHIRDEWKTDRDVDKPIPYTVTPAGKAALRGES
jgi:hypothetical protein